MQFSYSEYMQQTFPGRVSGIIAMASVHDQANFSEDMERFKHRASDRLADRSEGEFPEIKAWRKAFSTMGLKPTQYRCASEALLRRYRKQGNLPSIHPVVDLCNTVSIATAIPIAGFDLDKIAGDLTVRQADGSETYLTFGGDTENPEPHEVIFADDEGNAHARRWANRQSRLSAVSRGTSRVLIVAEALHDSAAGDMERLIADLTGPLERTYETSPVSAVLLEPAAVFNPSEKVERVGVG